MEVELIVQQPLVEATLKWTPSKRPGCLDLRRNPAHFLTQTSSAVSRGTTVLNPYPG